jgi:type III secretory pathway component EscR
MIFNKDYDRQEWEKHIKPYWIYFNLLIDELEWVNISDMSKQQKVDNPSYHVTNGFLLLKKSDYTKDEVYKKSAQKAWQDASHEDKMLTYQLPNFDADIAQEIFGIDFKAYLTQQNNDIIEVHGVKYKKI